MQNYVAIKYVRLDSRNRSAKQRVISVCAVHATHRSDHSLTAIFADINCRQRQMVLIVPSEHFSRVVVNVAYRAPASRRDALVWQWQHSQIHAEECSR
jgi:hypothetical protein